MSSRNQASKIREEKAELAWVLRPGVPRLMAQTRGLTGLSWLGRSLSFRGQELELQVLTTLHLIFISQLDTLGIPRAFRLARCINFHA